MLISLIISCNKFWLGLRNLHNEYKIQSCVHLYDERINSLIVNFIFTRNTLEISTQASKTFWISEEMLEQYRVTFFSPRSTYKNKIFYTCFRNRVLHYYCLTVTKKTVRRKLGKMTNTDRLKILLENGWIVDCTTIKIVVSQTTFA